MSTAEQQLKALEVLARDQVRINIDFDAWALFNVVAAVQLALRHEHLGYPVRELALAFCEHARDKIAAHDQVVGELIDRGFDQAHDA